MNELNKQNEKIWSPQHLYVYQIWVMNQTSLINRYNNIFDSDLLEKKKNKGPTETHVPENSVTTNAFTQKL